MTSTWTASALVAVLLSAAPDGGEARKSFRAGMQALEAGNPLAAAEAFETAAKEAPSWALAHLQWGIALQLYHPESARVNKVLEHAVELDPENPRANFALAKAYLRVSRQRDSIRTLEKTLALRDDYPDARFLLARTLANIGENTRAIEEMVRVLRREPTNTGAMITLAELYEKERRLKDAEAMLLRIAQLHPSGAYHFVRLAKFYERIGDETKAADARAHAEVVDPRPKREMRPLRRRRR